MAPDTSSCFELGPDLICPSRPYTISLLSLSPVIALPNWSGHRVVDTQGCIWHWEWPPRQHPWCPRNFPVSMPLLMGLLPIWGSDTHTHTYSLSLGSSPPWFLLFSRLCTFGQYFCQPDSKCLLSPDSQRHTKESRSPSKPGLWLLPFELLKLHLLKLLYSKPCTHFCILLPAGSFISTSTGRKLHQVLQLLNLHAIDMILACLCLSQWTYIRLIFPALLWFHQLQPSQRSASKNHVLFFYFFTFLLSVILNKEHSNMQKSANSKATSELHFPSPNHHLSSCAQPASATSFVKTFISLVAPGLICSTEHLPSSMQHVRSFSCGMWIL